MDVNNNKTFINLNGEDYHDIIVNHKLFIHINHSEGNYAVDLYKYPNKKEEDFISGQWVSNDDLRRWNDK